MLSRGRLVASVLVMLIYGMTVSTLAFGQGTAVSLNFDLQNASSPACWYWAVGFQAALGEEVAVGWNESGPPTSLDVYVVPIAALHQLWFCDQGPLYLYYDSGAFGSLNWKAPRTGDYAVLVVNYHWDEIKGMLTINARNVSEIGYLRALMPPVCNPLNPNCSP